MTNKLESSLYLGNLYLSIYIAIITKEFLDIPIYIGVP